MVHDLRLKPEDDIDIRIATPEPSGSLETLARIFAVNFQPLIETKPTKDNAKNMHRCPSLLPA